MIVEKILSWTKSKPSLVTKGLAEFTGCMIFHFLGSVSPTPMTNATALLVLVYYTARMSGAHLNPALSMTFAILGYTNPIELVVYWTAQFTGCIFGALLIAALVPGLAIGRPVGDNQFHGCFSPGNGVDSDSRILGWEAVGTFCFILPIFSVVWYTQHKSGYGNTGPIIVGVSLYAAASAVGGWTGAALNPARAIASSVVFQCPHENTLMYYVFGEFIGAMLVPLAIVPWYGVSSSIYGERDAGGGGGEGSSRSDNSANKNVIIKTDDLHESMNNKQVEDPSDRKLQQSRFKKTLLGTAVENTYECTMRSGHTPTGTPRHSMSDNPYRLSEPLHDTPKMPNNHHLSIMIDEMSRTSQPPSPSEGKKSDYYVHNALKRMALADMSVDNRYVCNASGIREASFKFQASSSPPTSKTPRRSSYSEVV